ncbi:MAG TPA: hypothetical protein VHO48_15535 [Anaerolineaceae bacterium]|nr:hypothetical protein [Anaerolineaceae bacterium]
MTDLPAFSTIPCSQCGGELHPDEGQIFLTCPYCSATVYLDKSRVVFHWYLAPTLDENQARGALARWMAGNQTVKDLDQKSRLTGRTFQYFPVWHIKRRVNGKEQVELFPAAAISITELRRLTLPAGDLRNYDDSLQAQAVEPSVPLETALGWSTQASPEGVQVLETALVHIPLYTFKYTYQKQTYTALVEAGTGAVLANIYPAKAEAPYLLAGGLAALVFICLATFPIFGAIIDDESGLMIGSLLCLGLGLLAAPALFALAMWVASKV